MAKVFSDISDWEIKNSLIKIPEFSPLKIMSFEFAPIKDCIFYIDEKYKEYMMKTYGVSADKFVKICPYKYEFETGEDEPLESSTRAKNGVLSDFVAEMDTLYLEKYEGLRNDPGDLEDEPTDEQLKSLVLEFGKNEVDMLLKMAKDALMGKCSKCGREIDWDENVSYKIGDPVCAHCRRSLRNDFGVSTS